MNGMNGMNMSNRKLKVYVAGSFRNAEMCREAGGLIRDTGIETYVFCDVKNNAFIQALALRELGLVHAFTPMTALHDTHIQIIYKENMRELMTSDVVVLILPCGRSAHLEAGWIKGADGGKLIIYGEMKVGEFDAMYGMADLVTDDFHNVLQQLAQYATEKKGGEDKSV